MNLYDDELEQYIDYSPSKPFIERFLRLGYQRDLAINEGLQAHIDELYREIDDIKRQLQYFESTPKER